MGMFARDIDWTAEGFTGKKLSQIQPTTVSSLTPIARSMIVTPVSTP
jgi:hypothetical protein